MFVAGQQQSVPGMPAINDRRVCAKIEGPFVLFLIGAQINKLWKLDVVLPFLADAEAA